MEMHDLLNRAGASERALVGVNRATWSRWLRGRSRVPHAVRVLMSIVVGGELPQGGKDWEGWRFRDGRLYDPSGQWHTPGTILAWHWVRQELQELRARENRAMPDDLPANVRSLPAARRGHRLTAELHRRLDSQAE